MTQAAITYPSNFPCFSRDSYGMLIDMGLVRAGGDSVLPTQRREYNNLPTVIQASFTMSVTMLFRWTWWVNQHVGKWVNFPIAHPFMNQGEKKEYAPARILSSDMAHSYRPFNTVDVSLILQLSPSIFAESYFP